MTPSRATCPDCMVRGMDFIHAIGTFVLAALAFGFMPNALLGVGALFLVGYLGYLARPTKH